MRRGIPYDSPEATALCGALTAIMHCASLRRERRDGRRARAVPGATSANARRTCCASSATTAAPPTTRRPDGVRGAVASCRCPSTPPICAPRPAGRRAGGRRDRALALGEQHGYRNAQVTLIAPTGTIGLVMDCDTTGIEPDFALVKFKKLAGGGYFKIVNAVASRRPSRNLGYTPQQIDDIVQYCVGSGTLARAARTWQPETARASSGFTEDCIATIDDAAARARSTSASRSTRFTVGDEVCIERLGIDPDERSPAGLQPARGARLHAERDRRGERVRLRHDDRRGRTAPEGRAPAGVRLRQQVRQERHARSSARTRHIEMMAARPAVHLRRDQQDDQHAERAPRSTTSAEAYRVSWQKMLKAIALYRDGSKLSQPLSSQRRSRRWTSTRPPSRPRRPPSWHASCCRPASRSPRASSSQYLRERRRLPERRAGYTQKARSAATRSTSARASTRTARSARCSSTCTRRARPSAA